MTATQPFTWPYIRAHRRKRIKDGRANDFSISFCCRTPLQRFIPVAFFLMSPWQIKKRLENARIVVLRRSYFLLYSFEDVNLITFFFSRLRHSASIVSLSAVPRASVLKRAEDGLASKVDGCQRSINLYKDPFLAGVEWVLITIQSIARYTRLNKFSPNTIISKVRMRLLGSLKHRSNS